MLEEIEIRHDLAILSLVGDGMRTMKGIAARFFTSLAQASINIVAISQGSSERSISAVVGNKKSLKRSKRVTRTCSVPNNSSTSFWLVWVVWAVRLLQQIRRQQAVLSKQGIGLRVVVWLLP